MLSPSIRRAYHIMAKPHGPVCNLNCTYCYYLEKKKLYPGTRNFKMDDDLLELYTRQYIESQDAPSVTFTWQGGEPTLMGLDFLKERWHSRRNTSRVRRSKTPSRPTAHLSMTSGAGFCMTIISWLAYPSTDRGKFMMPTG